MAVNNLNFQRIEGLSPGVQVKTPSATKPGEGELFKQALEKASSQKKPILQGSQGLPLALKFSNHAVERMKARGIQYSPEEMGKISSAIDKARQKGAKETLVLSDNSAMIVSVDNQTVVTVMDKQALKENVFTKIDSTVII